MTNKEAFISEIEKITENFEEPIPLQEILSEQAYDFFISFFLSFCLSFLSLFAFLSLSYSLSASGFICGFSGLTTVLPLIYSISFCNNLFTSPLYYSYYIFSTILSFALLLLGLNSNSSSVASIGFLVSILTLGTL